MNTRRIATLLRQLADELDPPRERKRRRLPQPTQDGYRRAHEAMRRAGIEVPGGDA